MPRIAVFDALPPHKEYQGHWVPQEVEDSHFREEVEYALPTVVIALTSESGDVIKFAAFGEHPPVGRCKNAATFCWCSSHGMEEDHTLEITAH